LPAWVYQHKTVCHAQGEYARDEDGDGFCKVHVNTMEGCWSFVRSRHVLGRATLRTHDRSTCAALQRRAWFKTGGLWVTPKVARAAPTKGFHVRV